MSRLRWVLFMGTLVALVLAIVSGAVLARRALAPVRQIAKTAKSLEESSDLSRRVDYQGPMDELGHLAATFDHMLEHLDRVFKSQRDFVADASHDLRSPLTVLQGNLDLLKRDSSEEGRQQSIEAMGREINRMTAILNDLLLLAEVESDQENHTETIYLQEVLRQGLAQAQQLSANHTIVEDRVENLSVQGNRHRLGQMMANLVSNAIKYTPDEGTITLSLFQDGNWARLEVADTGIGIASEHLPHLFDRFYRVDKARSREAGGTGLGLAIVKGIAEQHGGKVTVESESGKGSTFTVWLKL